MKKALMLAAAAALSAVAAFSQVTKINENKYLRFVANMNDTKSLFVSDDDKSLWISEGTSASTIQLGNDASYDGNGILLGEKFIFRGYTTESGSELYITDGTAPGTHLLKELSVGAAGSFPADFIRYNNRIFFSAVTPELGREIWSTDGTEAGTYLLKEIATGSADANNANEFKFTSTSVFLYFVANTAPYGAELWKTDGTPAATALVEDIEPGPSGSFPNNLFGFGDQLFFTAANSSYGRECWRSNGSENGTYLLLDAFPGTGSSNRMGGNAVTGFELTIRFHPFKDKVYFMAITPSSTNLYATDGTTPGTQLIKQLFVLPGWDESYPVNTLDNAINLPDKFMFIRQTDVWLSECELWSCDGTPAGTVPVSTGFVLDYGPPFILKNENKPSAANGDMLFKGNKFFFAAEKGIDQFGIELWISDGTAAGTQMVKDIGPGAWGIVWDAKTDLSFVYTSDALFFNADDRVAGEELWRTDGTSNGTYMVADLNSNGSGSPLLQTINNGRLYFAASDGTPATISDLYVINGSFQPLPLKFGPITVSKTGRDALLNWQTLQERNTRDFLVQRSFDARTFTDIGKVPAAGTSGTSLHYAFTDANVESLNQGNVYYRIVCLQQDGSEEVSKVVHLLMERKGWDLKVLGDARQGYLQLSVPDLADKNIQITICDIAGRRVYSTTLKNRLEIITIPVSYLGSGTYIVTVADGTAMKSVRFVK